MIDLTDYREMQLPTETKTIMTCGLRLDKKAMLNALLSDSIYINGEYFKVPERALLECLIDKRYGEIKLELEKI
jgi:hypothetical protein|tara:strand:- start:536 stop:757 length:222 start_codon:yes stop_codon:yes gene_type:complete